MYDDSVFRALGRDIEELDIPLDGAALVEAVGLIDRLSAKLAEAVGAFDAAGLWELDSAVSMTAWLRAHCDLTGSAAASLARTARTLRSLPVTAEAWREGSLSGGQVQAVLANVNDVAVELFAEHEAEVVPALAELSAGDTAMAMSAWAARAAALREDRESPEPKRAAHLSPMLDGRWRLDGSFDAEAGAIVAAAVGLATSPDAQGELRSAPERRADALTDICRHYLDHRGASPQGRRRPHLNVVVDYQELTAGGPGQVVGGGVLDGSEIRALLCDCEIHRVITDGRSVILDYGTATRTVAVALFAALALRDQRCRHPGCDRPVEWCEAHHVIPVLAGGETCLANLVLKCSRHHHIGHKPGWSEWLEPDGALVITDPRGRTYVSPPPGVLSPADSWPARAA